MMSESTNEEHFQGLFNFNIVHVIHQKFSHPYITCLLLLSY